jgi:hypothetical protein
MAGPHHRDPDYRRRAAAIRAAANANPTTRCWRCGQTQAEHQRSWTAGHLVDGDNTAPLAAECAHCNYSAGATHGNATATRTPPWMRY